MRLVTVVALLPKVVDQNLFVAVMADILAVAPFANDTMELVMVAAMDTNLVD